MNLKKPLGTLALTGLMLGALLVSGGGAQAGDAVAAAPNCGMTGSDKDHRAYHQPVEDTAYLRTGPKAGGPYPCGIVQEIYSTTTVDYHCYVWNDGYRWTYMRLKGTSTYGWVRGDLLSDGGAASGC